MPGKSGEISLSWSEFLQVHPENLAILSADWVHVNKNIQTAHEASIVMVHQPTCLFFQMDCKLFKVRGLITVIVLAPNTGKVSINIC